MSQTFSQEDYGLLQKHLQAQVEVEFLTVPFYLTAVYSFTQDALNSTLNWDNTTLYDLQQRTLSVAVQEMYHLQLACNLANAFNVTPTIPQAVLAAGTPITIPHLAPGGVPLTTELGNLPAVIEAMVEIETPDPNSTYPPPNADVVYDSISDLYHATLTLLARYLLAYAQTPAALDPNFSPNRYQVAWGAFENRYTYNKIANRGDVPRLANAITDQGEGHLVSPELQLAAPRVSAEVSTVFKFGEGGNVLPEYQPTPGSRFYQYDGLTHYARFEQIKAVVQSPPIVPAFFYQTGGTASPDLPSWAPSYQTVQDSLNTIWSYLVDVMQTGFGTGTLSDIPSFGDAMLSVKYLAPLIWQWGYCPSYEYRTGVTAEEAQDAMDAADPLCLFHWDKVTIKIREEYPDKKNTCEGLNQCAGLGWGGLGTQVGDGACATADLHTCQGTNSCKFQGGCAYLSSVEKKLLPTYEQWIPGVNQCKSMGGCQVPIATLQVFDSTADLNQVQPPPVTRLQDLQATKAKATTVWDEARSLLQIMNNVHRELSGENASTLPDPLSKQVSGGTDYDGKKRRTAISATSKQPTS